MKRTRKWSFVAQEAQRLASMGLSPLEIGRQLDVTKSTINRWIKSGKLTRERKRAVLPTSGGPQAPGEWAALVRKTYALDVTDEQLVTAAQQALELAFNMAETPNTRMNAMGRFQSIVKQLALVARAETGQAEPEKPAARAVAVRSGVDPRKILQAVK